MNELKERFDRLKKYHEDMGQDGHYNFNPNTFDYYRGLEIAMSILEDRIPQFKEVPEVWHEDRIGGIQ
jgi:hypothetical protein